MRIQSAFLALAIAVVPIAAQSQSPTLNANQQLAHDVYKELIEINTMDSRRDPSRRPPTRWRARFRDAGFPAADIHVLTRPDHPSKGNLVVRYRGTRRKAKPLLLLAHLDVVAALRATGRCDPFKLHEKDGYYYGRGTSDDKAMAAIFVANMLRDKKGGCVPDRDLILALTADEEGGDANGVEWLVQTRTGTDRRGVRDQRRRRRLAAQRQAVLHTRAGGGEGRSTSRSRRRIAAGIRIGAARRQRDLLSSPRRSCVSRASVPGAAQRRHARILRADGGDRDAGDGGRDARASLANPNDSVPRTPSLSEDPRYNSMLRTTCVATRLAGGHADNALPQTATANRQLPHRSDGDRRRDVRAAARARVRGHGHQDHGRPSRFASSPARRRVR